MSLRLSQLVACGVAVCGALACASPPPKTSEEIGKAELAIHDAEASEAAARAPADLALAKEKLARAQRAFDAADYTEARRLGSEAVVDAQLAETRAEADAARAAATGIDPRR